MQIDGLVREGQRSASGMTGCAPHIPRRHGTRRGDRSVILLAGFRTVESRAGLDWRGVLTSG